jgi:hypothetical protein
MMNFIPGFPIIRNKLITPLIVATERVVDYILPEYEINKEESDDTSPKDKEMVS